jgi:hypothetical protein
MAKEPMHPIQKICSNCQIISKVMLAIEKAEEIFINTIPYDCPVARKLMTTCDNHSVPTIKGMYRKVTGLTREV